LWLLLFVGLLAGLGLARISSGPSLIMCLLLLPWLIVAIYRRSWVSLLVVLCVAVSFGWWRGTIFMQKLADYEPLYYQKVTITARASEDAIYGKTKQLAFAGHDIRLEDGQKLTGKVQLSGYGVNAVFQGDEVTAAGKLYPGYGSYQGRISFAVLQVTAHHPSLISETRRRFIAGTQSVLPEPLGPYVMGILVGQRATLPEELKDDFRKVGLTHIIAVSGYNLTIILQASRRLLGKRSKRIATFLSLALIGVFLVIAGASASIVRAAMVSVLSITTAYYGRSFRPLNLICLAAAITAWANPVYIWSDLGWYLSFLAFFGVMILSPLVQARWPARWHKSVIGGVALESICAEVMALPFVLYIFGQMSRVGLLANVLVVSLVPLAMLLGVICGLAGMLFGAVAGWFTWPAIILLNYMLDVAHILANLSNIFVEGIGLSLFQMLIIYGCIGLLCSVLWYKNPRKSVMITEMTEPKTRGLLA
jgi:competence protein ComEC